MRFFSVCVLLLGALSCLSPRVSGLSIHTLRHQMQHQHALQADADVTHHTSVAPVCPNWPDRLPYDFSGGMCMVQSNWPRDQNVAGKPGWGPKVVINALQLEKKVEVAAFLDGTGQQFGTRLKAYLKDNGIVTVESSKKPIPNDAYTHFGVVVFEMTTTNPAETTTFFCSALNHRETGQFDYSTKANRGDGDIHTERYCMNKFTAIVDAWKGGGRTATARLSFCTEKVLCDACVGRLRQFYTDMTNAGVALQAPTTAQGAHRQLCG